MKKNELRELMKKKRREISKDERLSASFKICEKIMGLEKYKNAETVCIYVSAFNEVDTCALISDCREKKKKLIFPVTNVKNHTITLCLDSGEFVSGGYGIKEPHIKKAVPFSEPDIVIVPGLAFDLEKNRLGFGAGYYDRLLSECNAFKVGICYDFQLVEKIEAENHDVKMDMIITDKKVLD